jgi:radical SAM protein with 4Fe4S-binding SPASM domain
MRKILEKIGFYPRICVWELTLACNMRCGHCGSRAGQARPNELTPEEAQKVANELADLGCQRVTLSGGEPILRKDWPAIARTLSDRGVKVNMVSNGWGWTEDTVTAAKTSGMRNVCFSIDGLEVTHDAIRREGSFARAMNAFSMCRQKEFPTASIMTVNRRNIDEIDAVHDLLVDIGVRLWQPQLSDAMGNQSDNIEWAFHPEDMPAVEEKLAEIIRRSPMRVTCGDNIGYYGPNEELLRRESSFGFWVGCFAGCQVVGIEADGNIKGCLSQQDAAFVEGNLRDTSLTEIWNRKGAFAYNREFHTNQLEGFCGKCRYNDICRGGCTCSAHFASGSRFDNPFCLYRVHEMRKQGVVERIGSERVDDTIDKLDTDKTPCQPALTR